jgi:hypothetical protein
MLTALQVKKRCQKLSVVNGNVNALTVCYGMASISLVLTHSFAAIARSRVAKKLKDIVAVRAMKKFHGLWFPFRGYYNCLNCCNELWFPPQHQFAKASLRKRIVRISAGVFVLVIACSFIGIRKEHFLSRHVAVARKRFGMPFLVMVCGAGAALRNLWLREVRFLLLPLQILLGKLVHGYSCPFVLS